ncbi:MAG: hypothetical protein NC301_03930 [Bacteroides sp.]|nr:hypothetical protein [Bacteroides sp.]MCM1378662.1 hypothetical protein [Bacteroides sp.]MCM1444935.1 hypothetical protein [Prevotella sp.]
MTEIHITADKYVWTGASTTALLCAQQAECGVIISAGDEDILRRMLRSGVATVSCPMSGLFASLNLSRALRHIKGTEFEIYLHSPQIQKSVESAIKLVGRDEPMILMPRKMPVFTRRTVDKGENMIMWLGNVTPDCGLQELIEDFATLVGTEWKLRVVGQGKAKVVTPILKRTKALGISGQIEWVGYSDNPFEHMTDVTLAIVKSKESIAAKEFQSASIPTYTKLSEIL